MLLYRQIFDNIKYMNILNKHFWKFLVGLLAMMILGLSVAYGTSWYEKQQLAQKARKQQQDYAAYEAQYLNDTYGSTTPEGTLQLFIDALKKDDIDLAVKYFVIDDQDYQRKQLLSLSQGQMKLLAADVEMAELSQKESNFVKFEYKRKLGKNQVFVDGKQFELNSSFISQPIDIAKGPNNIWKITAF